ncbi:hypothetical protein Tco_1010949 [Tanacetum coccineum]
MDFLSFIRTADPTKVRVGERQRAEDEPKLLDTTVGRVVPLLPVAPARGESELEDSVDKLFDEGGSDDQAEQGDFAGGGQGVGIQFVSEAAEVVAEDVASLQPRRQKKRKIVVVDAGEPSYPAKKLRDDHDASTGPSVAGKSNFALQRLLAGAMLNPEVGIAALPTLPFVTSSVSATPEQEGEDQTGSMARANIRTITAPQRFVISSDSSHHSGANVAEAEVDSVVRSFALAIATITTVTATVDVAIVAKEAPIKPSLFGVGSSSTGGADSAPGYFSIFMVVYVPQWSVTNGSRLDDGHVCREMLDKFPPPNFFASIRGMEHDQLFTEVNVGAARQIPLSTKVRMCAEYNIKEKRRLRSVVDEQTKLLKPIRVEAIEKYMRDEVRVLKDHNTTLKKEKSELDVKVADLVASVKVREQEVADLDAVVTSVKSQNDNLVDQVHKLETSSAMLQEKVTVYEDCMSQLEKFHDERMEVVYEKLTNCVLTLLRWPFIWRRNSIPIF